MAKFSRGETILLKNGKGATVISEFGSGGQGTVYKVEYDGSEYALKWYHIGVLKDPEAFYKNLENNISIGSPDKSFLWPLAITEKFNGSFGYLMNIRPSGYDELTNYFVGTKQKVQVHFKSFFAMFTAAINIAHAFRELHNKGYSYQDINNGNFFINSADGDVLICDNDNVSPYGSNFGIMGKQRWMAPEIVIGKIPGSLSDRFSLAVVLFRLLFINHPLEGRYSTPPCMTKEMERKYYGTDPIFILDPSDDRNRPIPGTDKNLKLFWNIYPQYLRDAFIREFSQDVMLSRKDSRRMLEAEWLDIFFRLRAELGYCPYCKEETFYNVEDTVMQNTCMQCNRAFPLTGKLSVNNLRLPLHDRLKVYLWHIDSSREDIESIMAEIVSDSQNQSLLGIKNCSTTIWKVKLLDGSEKPLSPGRTGPARKGIVIDMVNDENRLVSL
jgi:serine/threonine protein kinase